MATLIVNDSASRCGNCGKGADPIEARHATVLDYQPGIGCGVRFTEIGTENPTLVEGVRNMRPDLVFIGFIGHGLTPTQSN